MRSALVRASKDNSEGKWYSVVLSKFSENHECVMGFLQWLDISSSQVCVFQSCQQEPSRKKVFVGTLSDGGRVAGWLNRKEGVSLSRIQTKYFGVRAEICGKNGFSQNGLLASKLLFLIILLAAASSIVSVKKLTVKKWSITWIQSQSRNALQFKLLVILKLRCFEFDDESANQRCSVEVLAAGGWSSHHHSLVRQLREKRTHAIKFNIPTFFGSNVFTPSPKRSSWVRSQGAVVRTSF